MISPKLRCCFPLYTIGVCTSPAPSFAVNLAFSGAYISGHLSSPTAPEAIYPPPKHVYISFAGFLVISNAKNNAGCNLNSSYLSNKCGQ